MSYPYQQDESDQYNNQSMPKLQLRHTPYSGKFSTTDQSLFDSKDIATHSQSFDIVAPCSGTGDAMLQMQNPPLLAFRNKTNIQKVGFVTPNIASPKNTTTHNRSSISNSIAQSSLLQRRPLTALKDPEIHSLDVVRKQIEQEKMTIDFKEDPVAYFSKRKDGRGHRFIYLVHKGDPHDPYFSPYDLVKVPFAEIKGDYFTMSATGVTHVYFDGTTETISLDLWAQEKSIFNSIRKLKIFAQFFFWKPFRIWKNFVMQQRYSQLDSIILYHPFFKNKEFFSLALFIYNNQAKAKNMLHKFLLAFQSQRKFKLAEFIQTNKDNIEHLKVKYEKFINKTMLEVQSLYTTISNPKLVQVHDSDFPDIKRRNPNLAQLMVLEKRKATKRMAKTEAVNRQIMEIGGFIRLIDYMLLESLSEGCHESWKNAETNVTSDRSSVFVIDVLYDNDGKVTFTPTLEVLVESIETVLHESLKTLNLLPRLLMQLPLKPFLRDNGLDYVRLFEEGPQFAQVIDKDLLKKAKEHIIEVVKTSYHECYEVSQSFSNFFPIYRMGQTWNVSDYLITPNGKKFDGHLDYDLSEEVINDEFLLKTEDQPTIDFERVTQDINKFREDRKRVENMRNGAVRGALFIDSKGLKAILAPISEKSLSDLQELLTNLASLKIDKLRCALQLYCRKLKQEPQTLDDYVTFCELIERCQKTTPQIEKEIEFIDKLFSLFDKFGFQHDENPNHTLFNVFMNDKNAAVATKTDQLGIFTEAIKGMIAEIERKINKYHEKATTIPIDLKTVDIDVSMMNSKKLCVKIDNLKPRVVEVIRQQKIMEVSFNDFKEYESLKITAAFSVRLYEAVNRWLDISSTMAKVPFKRINVESFTNDVQSLLETVIRLREDAPTDTEYPLLDELFDKINEIAPFLGELDKLSHGKMQLRHWNLLFESCDHKDQYHDEITIGELLRFGILFAKEKINEITATSQGESELEAEFVGIMNHWETVQMPLAETQIKIEETLLLGPTDSLLHEIQDTLATLSRMLSLPYVQGIREDVSKLGSNLENLSLIIEMWQLFQGNWVVLSALFSIAEAKTILPNQANRFTVVQKKWSLIAHHTLKDTRLFRVCNYPNLLEILKENNKTMESILVSLGKYLDVKRQASPRLFFLGNSEVLTLVTTSSIEKMTSILTKVFMHVAKIDCHENDGGEGESTYTSNNFQRLRIYGLIGEDGDSIQFQRHIQYNSSFENLINQIVDSMKTTVKDAIAASIPGCQSGSFVDWAMTTPTYIAYIALNAVFCNEMEDCFAAYESNPRAFQQYEAIMKRRIEDATDSFLMPLSSRDKYKLNVILTELLGFRDRFRLATEKLQNHSPYLEWLNSLRFRFLPNSTSIQVEFADVKLDHGYEYWGKTPILIHTPTIDACLSDCIYSLNQNQLPMITASASSAKQIIGKTLACLFGQFTYIVRPFPDMSEYFISKILTGVVSTGALAIFSGIEQLSYKSLSFLFDNVHSIISSIESGSSRITISNRISDLNKHCRVLLTSDSNFMSYGNIPPQLKSYVRPISLLTPNYSKIIEIFMTSTGFRETKTIIPKFSNFITTFHSIFQSVLPNLSLVSRIIKICSKAKEMIKQQDIQLPEEILIAYNSYKTFQPICDEARVDLLKKILFNAFQLGGNVDEMMTKLNGIKKEIDESLLRNAIEEEISSLKLEVPSSYLADQVLTLYNMMKQNYSIIIVGPPNSGKSTILEVLRRTFNRQEILDSFPEDKKIDLISLFHLSENWNRMYGQIYDDSNVGAVYSYGEIQSAIYHIISNNDESHSILKFDGKVTKSFSSFISQFFGSSQNERLMLNSLETFNYSMNFHIVIETDDLKNATPSLLAKSGILVMKNLQSSIPLIQKNPSCSLTIPSIPFARALKKCSGLIDEKTVQSIRSIFEQVSPAIIQKVYHLNNIVCSTENLSSNKLKNGHILLGEILSMYSVVLAMKTINEANIKQDDEDQLRLCLILSFARIYSGVIASSQLMQFNSWLCSEYHIELPKDWVGFTVSPAFSECFDHPQLLSIRLLQGEMIPLSSSDLEKPPIFTNSMNKDDKKLPLFVDQLNVIHPQILPALHITELLITSRQNVIIHGPSDSGKTSFLPIIFDGLKNVEPIVVSASCYLTGESITNYLINHTTLIAKSRSRSTHEKKNYILVFDGIEKEHVELMEFIRMLITSHSIPHFSPNDQKVFEFANLSDFSVVVTTRCYNELPSRFLAHFAPVSLPSISETTASFIGNKILQTYGYSKELSENLMKASMMTLTQFHFMSIIHNIMSICSSLCFLSNNSSLVNVTNALLSELYYTCLHKYQLQEYSETVPTIFADYFKDQIEIVKAFLLFDPLIYPTFESTTDSIKAEIMPHTIQSLQDELNYYLTLHNTNSIEKISMRFTSVIVREWSLLNRTLSRPGHNALLYGKDGSGRYIFSRLITHQIESDFVCIYPPTNDELLNEKNRFDAVYSILKDVVMKAVSEKKKSVIYATATNENEKEIRIIADFATKLTFQPFFSESELDELYEKAVQPSPKPVTTIEREQARISVINLLRYHVHFLINVGSKLNYNLDYNRFDRIEFKSDCQENYDSVVSVMLKSDEMKDLIKTNENDMQKLLLFLPKIVQIAEKFTTIFSPNKFYDFVDSFSHFVQDDFKEIEMKEKNISAALRFIKMLKEESTKVNEHLESLAPNLHKLQVDSDNLKNSYNTRKEAIEVRKVKLEQESKEKKEEVENLIKEYKEREQEKLNQKNIVETITKEVEKLNDNDIETIRITASDPHPALRLLLEMFCALLELPPSYEKSGQKLLMGAMFVQTITTKITEDTITPKLLEEAQTFHEDPKLNEKDLETIAPALIILYRWISNLLILARIDQEILEKKKNLDEKQRLLDKFIEDMNIELPSIEQVEKTLQAESQSLVESNKKRALMEEEYSKIDQRKKSIDSIFKGIDKITDKWESETKNFNETCSKLIGNSILFSFYLVFCGSMNLNDRQESLKEVMELLKTAGINTSYEDPLQSINDRFFADSINNSLINSNLNATFNLTPSHNLNSTMNEQIINSLPSTKSNPTSSSNSTFASTLTSINSNNNEIKASNSNATTSASWSQFDPCQIEVRHLTTCIRTPLLFDPDGIVLNLFSSTVKTKKLITVSQSVSNLENILQNAISEGKILVLTDCNDLNPLVSSVLSLLLFIPKNKNVSKNIRVGSKLVNWDTNFKLVLVSSLARIIDLPNDLVSRVTIIDASETSLQSTKYAFERQLIEFFEPELAPKILEMKRVESLHNVQIIKCEHDTLELLSDVVETQESNSEYDCLDDETIISDLIKLKESLLNAMSSNPDFSTTRDQMNAIIDPLKNHVDLCKIFWRVISRDLIIVNKSAFFAFNAYLKQVSAVISSSGIHPNSITEEQQTNLSLSISNTTFQFIIQSLPISDCLFFMFMSAFYIKKYSLSDLYVVLDHISSEITKTADFGNKKQQQNQDSFELLMKSNVVPMFDHITQFIKDSFTEDYLNYIPFFQFDAIIPSNASTPTIVVCDTKELLNPTALIQHFVGLRQKHENLSIASLYNDSDLIRNTRKMIQISMSRGNWIIVHYSEASRVAASLLTDVFTQMTTTNVNANFRLIVLASTTLYLPKMMLTKSKRVYVESYPSIKNNMLSYFQHHSSSIRSTTNPRAMKILSYVCALLLSSLSFRNFLTPVGFASFFHLNDLAFRDMIEQLRIIIDAHPNDAPLRNLRTQIDQLICAGIGEIHDRRTIQAHTSQMIKQATLEDGFSVAAKSIEKEIWKVPFGETPLGNFRQIIQKIPIFTSTVVLHMSSRSLLSWNLSIWATKPFVKFNQSRREGLMKEFDFKGAMMKLDNFAMLMPDQIVLSDDDLKNKALNPIGLFLIQEVEKLNEIVIFLREEMSRLTYEFMKGIASDIGIDFNNGKVPMTWAKVTKISNFVTFNSFISHVIERHSQLTRLIQEKDPVIYDIRLIEFPSMLLRSFILNCAIQDNQPLDLYSYQFSIVPDENSKNLKENRCLYLNKVCLANADYIFNPESCIYEDDNNDGELIISKSGKNPYVKPFKLVTSLVAKVVFNSNRQTKLFPVPMYKNAIIRSMQVEPDVCEIANGETKNFVWSVYLPTDVAEIDMQQFGTTLFCRMPEQFI
ncbi:hypothetical protein M9Y10_023999 [Tritrichomonas musculus]|uniref:Dynein heavy chain family protein n=1 Tax=Tritrichomonas musculus TaxID=1915356 RepID=A0ABR2KYK8_9EUKA